MHNVFHDDSTMIHLYFSRMLYAAIIGILGFISLPPAAHAVGLSNNGQGQVLIFPYYSLRDDNDTLLAITNHTEQAKALKVRVVEGDGGRVALSFNLYLGPRDSWTATITDDNIGSHPHGPVLFSRDPSCTVPATAIRPLTVANLPPPADSGRDSEDRVHEGYVEVIEMGTIDLAGLGGFAAFFPGVSSSHCDSLTAAWASGNDPGIWRQDAQTDMGPPTGGLSGQAVVIRISSARATPYQAVALDHFYRAQSADDPVSLHTAPETIQPGLNSAFPATSYVRAATAQGPTLINDTWDSGALAVSAALAGDRIRNQYASEAMITGLSEWVLTFPTKHHLTQATNGPQPPFTATFDEPVSGQGDGRACEALVPAPFTRSGHPPITDGPVGVRPPPPDDPALCYTVNVVSFAVGATRADAVVNETEDRHSELLASRLLIHIDPRYRSDGESGWAHIDFNGTGLSGATIVHQLVNPISGRVYHGLPAVGFAALGAANRTLNALFGTGFGHETIVRISE